VYWTYWLFYVFCNFDPWIILIMSFTEAMKVVGIAISNFWSRLGNVFFSDEQIFINVVGLWHFLSVGFTTHMTTIWLMPFRSVNVALCRYFFYWHTIVCNVKIVIFLQHDELKPLSKTFTNSLSELGNLKVMISLFKNGRRKSVRKLWK